LALNDFKSKAADGVVHDGTLYINNPHVIKPD